MNLSDQEKTYYKRKLQNEIFKSIYNTQYALIHLRSVFEDCNFKFKIDKGISIRKYEKICNTLGFDFYDLDNYIFDGHYIYLGYKKAQEIDKKYNENYDIQFDKYMANKLVFIDPFNLFNSKFWEMFEKI